MLSKRFYNILTIIFIILIIALFFFKGHIQTKYIMETMGGTTSVEEKVNQIGEGSSTLTLLSIIQYILIFGYYLFILILAIQLYSREKLSMTNTIIVAILIPLAPIFYIFTLRKPLKEFESSNTPKIKQT